MKQVFLVYDVAVRNFAAAFKESYKADYIGSMPLVCDEQHKTLASVENICRALMGADADKKTILLAIGGGTCSDICGLAASLYKRGIDLETVPTTLLAMADAAIGGKNAVNLDGVKNMIGTFRLPKKIHFRTEALNTLPDKEIRSGAVEILKTFLLFDEPAYQRAVHLLASLHKSNYDEHTKNVVLEELETLAEKAAKYKKKVVRRDFFDRGKRRLLNFGHTYGHAIEWKSKGVYTHGEAVAMGIIKALRLSEEYGIAPPASADRIARDFMDCGLPTEIPYLDKELVEAMENDKKIEGGKISFVFLKRPGKAVLKKRRLTDLV